LDFTDLGLHQKILDAVKKEGYVTPSPIQVQAMPPALAGRDVLGCAQTGTGKTAAFAIPILQRLYESAPEAGERRRIRAVVMTPTRELAQQIYESFRAYGRYLPLKCGVIMGGVSQHLQTGVLKSGVDILVATPGRLLDLCAQGLITLGYIETFVLDEADRMLDMGFIHDVKKVIELLPKKRQTLFFTATMPPEILKLTGIILENPVHVSVTPPSSVVEKIKQTVYFTDKVNKPDLLIWLLKNNTENGSAWVFTRTKYGADKLAQMLKKANILSLAIHGDKSQGARQNALASFKNGSIRALVATDIAARGIDIEDLPYVINFELPNVPETYIHRIGRTGRAGKEGTAISLCDFDEKEYLTDIERLIKTKIQAVADHPYPMAVFVKSPPKVQQPRPPRPQWRR
jgi:ATP-dependent RNA helicase RhlE